MYESGYYPAGAESDPRAPWNEREPTMVNVLHVAARAIIGTPTTLRQTTKQNVPKKHGICFPKRKKRLFAQHKYCIKGKKETCEVCDGEGEVEYEPDYDDYDED